MHRLTQLQHHVLGNVHQETDRADAAATQALRHPHRCGHRRIHTFDHTPDEARHFGPCFQLDGQRAVDNCRHGSGIECDHFTATGRGHVESDAAHAETVGTVRGQLDLDAGIGQRQIVGDRRANRCVVRQFQQTRRIGIDPQLLGRTQHAVGLHATQLGRLDGDFTHYRTHGSQRSYQAGARIGCTTDDLQQLALPCIDLADLQTISLRMLGALHDPHHDHAGK